MCEDFSILVRFTENNNFLIAWFVNGFFQTNSLFLVYIGVIIAKKLRCYFFNANDLINENSKFQKDCHEKKMI